MNDRKTYTAAELNSAEKLMKILSSIPEEKRTILIMMANSFMAGMEAKESRADTSSPRHATTESRTGTV